MSLFPSDAVAGLFRRDLFDTLKELQPSFMRFPGGDYTGKKTRLFAPLYYK